jgi:CubicO group peptidase (beta-lactamase class C family)
MRYLIALSIFLVVSVHTWASTDFLPPELGLVTIEKSSAPSVLIEGRQNISSRNRRLANNFLKDKGLADNAIIFIKDEVSYKQIKDNEQLAMVPGAGISRSIVGLTIGKLLCEQKINSLDDRVEKYVPALLSSSWGNASIKDLLLMRSGANNTNLLDHGFVLDKKWMGSKVNGISWLYASSFEQMLLSSDDKLAQPGYNWNYNNFDTIALGLLIEELTGNGFIDYFKGSIWSEVGAAHKSAWVTNAAGVPLYNNGFLAHPEDWLRFGLWVFEQLSSNDKCFKDYISASLESDVVSATGVKYGFHKWVACGPYIDFCFIGEGGQYLLFNRKSNVVMFASSSDESKSLYIPALFQEFIGWQNLN